MNAVYVPHDDELPIYFNFDPNAIYQDLTRSDLAMASEVVVGDEGMPIAAVVVMRGDHTADYLRALTEESERAAAQAIQEDE